MDYLRNVFDRTRIKLLISAGIALLTGLIFLTLGIVFSSKQKDQQLASRWSEKKDFSQVSVFFSELAGFDENGVKELKYKIDNKLSQDSIASENENARTWVYAYSAFGEVSAYSHNADTRVKAIGVGGDYFLFHPFELVSGSFFDSEYMMKDLVLLDVETAWRLFGSTDVEGQVIEIGGVRHVVSGVVKSIEGRLNRLAGNNEPVMYLSYEALSENGNVSYINSFEALMPNPLSTYARDAVKELVPSDEKRFEVVENTGRFNWVRLLKHVKEFGTRGMTAKAIVYPYWENAARGMEDYLTPVALLGMVSFGYAGFIALYILLRMWKKREIHLSTLKNFAEAKIDDKRRKKREITIEEID